MRNLLISLLLIVLSVSSFSSYGQCASIINGSKPSLHYKYHDNPLGHWYVSGSFDVNNGLDLSQTEMEPKGLDFDVELGVRSRSFSYYAFYGEYSKIEYSNYGAGIEYFFIEDSRVDVTIGGNMGVITRDRSYLNKPISYLTAAVRSKAIYDISNSIGLFLTGQYQLRPDRNIHGIFEPMMGIQFYIN